MSAAQGRLFDDADAGVELRVQAILASRRNANTSGQNGEDIDNIRAAILDDGCAVMPTANLKGRSPLKAQLCNNFGGLA